MILARWRYGRRGGFALPVRSSQRLRDYAIKSVFPSSTTTQKASVVPLPTASKDAPMFERVVEATTQFHAIHGHFVIPVGFRVPPLRSGPNKKEEESIASLWPIELRGFALGFKLKALLTNPKHKLSHHQIVDELRTIGVPVDIDWRNYLWQHMTLKALQVYKDVHGDVLVPRNFRVPYGDDRWPRTTWGFRLGLRVMNMRQQRYDVTPSEAADLEQLGFVWDAHDYTWRTRVLPALLTFKSVMGHCNVGQTFIVPSHAPWPKETWGLQLGTVVNSLRSPVATYQQQVLRDHEILDDIGFVWNAVDERWDRMVLPALDTYAHLYGAKRLPHQKFVVPAEAPWPKETWNLRLGVACYNIRHIGVYHHHVLRDAKRLKAMGWLHLLTVRWEQTMVEAAANR